MFGEVSSLSSAFSVNAGRNEVTLAIDPMVPIRTIKSPGRANHFQIVSHVFIFSNYEFDAEEKTYMPVDKINSSKYFTSISEILPINEASSQAINVVTSLSSLGNLAPSSAIIACVGIRFHEMRVGKLYPVATGGAMQLKSVF